MMEESVWIWNFKENKPVRMVDESIAIEYQKVIAGRLKFLLENVVESEEGVFTFPDGVSFPCKKRVGYIYTKVGD